MQNNRKALGFTIDGEPVDPTSLAAQVVIKYLPGHPHYLEVETYRLPTYHGSEYLSPETRAAIMGSVTITDDMPEFARRHVSTKLLRYDRDFQIEAERIVAEAQQELAEKIEENRRRQRSALNDPTRYRGPIGASV